MWIDKKKNFIKILMRDIIISYFASAFIVITIKAYMAFIEDELLFENIMLNFRSFIFGLVDTNDMFFVTRFENVGLFSYHLTLFFALFFYLNFYDDKIIDDSIEKKIAFKNTNKLINALLNNNWVKCILVFVIGIFIYFFVSKKFPFCILLGFIFSSVIFIIVKIIELVKVKIYKKNIFDLKKVLIIERIILFLWTVLCLILEFSIYFE